MVEVRVLPPQEVPKHTTVNVKVNKLQDHLLSFLNYNNKNGFVTEFGYIQNVRVYTYKDLQTIDTNTIGQLMFTLAEQEEIELGLIKHYAFIIKTKSQGSLKHGHALELIARMLGYKDWNDLSKYSKNLNKTTVRNFRDKRTINLELFGKE